MAQADIQSLLQDLTGVHSAGAAWVPSAVNNGNPNTAYNNAPAQQVPFVPPAGASAIGHNQSVAKGYIPPTTNAFGGWNVNVPGSWGKLTNWEQMSAKPQAVGAPAGFAGWGSLADYGHGWTPGGGTGGNPPALPPGTPGMHTGGPLPPQQGDLSNSPKWGGGGSLSGKGLSILDLPPGEMSGMFSSTGGQGMTSSKDFMSGLKGMGDMTLNLGSMGASLGNTSLGRALGVTKDGTIDVGQILDLVIPGNVYMGQTHQTNWANAIPGLLSRISPVLGFAVAKWMDMKGSQYANVDDSQLGTGLMGWLRKMLKTRYLKNQANRNPNNNTGNGGNDKNGAAGGYGSAGGGSSGGGFMGGSYGWGGGTGLGSVTIGGTGPGEIGDVSGSGTLGGLKFYQK